MNYRNAARDALNRAKQELDNSETHRLRYVALELRMAIESLVYERAGNYTEELSNKKLSTWQPKQLLNLLLEIDPLADKSSAISVGIEEEYGKPAKTMNYLGKERVISLAEIKKYYDRLGSYLHTPTLDQINQSKGANSQKIRIRCNEIIEILDQVLASPVFNLNIKTTSSMSCMRCGTKIVRRLPPKTDTVITRCIECSASYNVTDIGENKVEWTALIHEIECANPSCNYLNKIWKNDIKEGAEWECPNCMGINKVVLALTFNNQTNC